MDSVDPTRTPLPLEEVDERLRELGEAPADLEQQLVRYLGSSRISAVRADVLLAELVTGVPAEVAASESDELELSTPTLPAPPSRRSERPSAHAAAEHDLPHIGQIPSLPRDDGFEVVVDDDLLTMDEEDLRSAQRR